jgi:hypothetical protein
MSSGSGLKRLYYKAFAEAKPPALSQRFVEGTMLTEFAAMIAIDWADQKHAWAMQTGTSKVETGAIDHTPEAIDVWAAELQILQPAHALLGLDGHARRIHFSLQGIAPLEFTSSPELDGRQSE